jgi:hypothetical protein
MALLNSDCLKEPAQASVPKLIAVRIKGGINKVIRILFTKQPVWKTAVASVLAVALVFGICLTVSQLSTNAVYAKAINSARNSPEVRAALGENADSASGEVVQWTDKEGTIIYEGKTGPIVVVVDVANGKVISSSVSVYSIVLDAPDAVPSDTEKQEAIDIAKADPRVKELLDQGAILPLAEVERACTIEDKQDPATGKWATVTNLQIQMQMHLGYNIWRIRVNPDEKQVVFFSKIPPDITP